MDIEKKYLGIKYKHRGRNPDEGLDCYGLIICVYRDLGFELMDVDNYEMDFDLYGKDYFIENYHKQWVEVPVAHEFDVVLYKTREGVANHAGVVLTGNRCLQTTKAGVVITRLNDPFWYCRQVGFYRLKERIT